MVEVLGHVELDQVLEQLLVVDARVDGQHFLGVRVGVFVDVGLAEGGIGAAEVVAHLLHHLLVEDVLGAAEGQRRPPVAHLAVLHDQVRLDLLLDDVALGGVVVVLAALQTVDLDRLAETRLVDLALQLVVELQVGNPLVDGLHEPLAVDVVGRGEVGRDGRELGGPPGDDRGKAIAVVRDLVFEGAGDGFEDVVQPLLAEAPAHVHVDLARLDDVNALVACWLVEHVVWVDEDVHQFRGDGLLEVAGPSAEKED